MFRKLYWVTEQVESNGHSSVTGVYTSIPNLVKEGMTCNKDGCMRLTLTKLDSESGPLGSWVAPSYDGLRERLDEFVRTDEFTAEQCDSLMNALNSTKKAGV